MITGPRPGCDDRCVVNAVETATSGVAREQAIPAALQIAQVGDQQEEQEEPQKRAS